MLMGVKLSLMDFSLVSICLLLKFNSLGNLLQIKGPENLMCMHTEDNEISRNFTCCLLLKFFFLKKILLEH